MNKAIFALLLSLPVAASANTVTFLGEVSDSTCDITINGNTGDSVVQLQTVSSADLNQSGKTAGEKEFSFNVSGCTKSTQTEVGIRLLANFVDATAGNLKNIAAVNPAENVTIQISENATPINFTNGQYTSAMKTIGETALSFPFTAQYYATGVATPGNVEAKLEYALSYN